jgi:hypothetical protein
VAASDYVQVLTTAGSEAEAQRIADALVESRLAGSPAYLAWIGASVRP